MGDALDRVEQALRDHEPTMAGDLHEICRELATERKKVRQLEADLLAPFTWRKQLPATIAEWEDMRNRLRAAEEKNIRLTWDLQTAEANILELHEKAYNATGQTWREVAEQRLVQLNQERERIAKLHTARTFSEWHEDLGDVLWHLMPINSPPYLGSPLCSSWPFGDCDETPRPNLVWTPMPDCNEIQDRFEAEAI